MAALRSRPAVRSEPVGAALDAEEASAPQTLKPSPRHWLLRALLFPCPAWPMVIIWAHVGANWFLHVMVCDCHTWAAGPALYVVGHALVILQVACFVRTVGTHPGVPPPNWQQLVLASDAEQQEQHRRSHFACTKDESIVVGSASSSADQTCTDEACDSKRAWIPVPPRARFVKKRGEVILGFDHDCFWMGVPIGFRNRKFFVLFVCWSAALSLFGAILSMAELYYSEPITKLLTFRPPADSEAYEHLRHVQRNLANNNPMANELFMLSMQLATLSAGTIKVSASIFFILAVDVVATILLGCFGVSHINYIRRNVTSLQPFGEEVYDVGTSENVRQVLGRKRWQWMLPIGTPEGDGLNWPRRPPVEFSEWPHE